MSIIWERLLTYPGRNPVDSFLLLASICVLTYLWVNRRGGRRYLHMTRQQWTAHKAKEKAKRRQRSNAEYDRIEAAHKERKRARAEARSKRKDRQPARSLAVPTKLRTNVTMPLAGSPKVPAPAVMPPPVIHDAAAGRRAEARDLPTLPKGYRDFKILGSGGFADVMFARQMDGTPVAIKTLRHTSSDREIRERWFRREVRLLSELKSPAIPRLIEHRLDVAHPYFVMEFIEGRNVNDFITAKGPLRDLQLVKNLMIDTATALVEMHGKGFIHRDIKPSNVMVTSLGQFRLIDLGIGKDTGSDSTASHLTAGTLAFSAPETVSGAAAGSRSDIFSWGATIGYAMTGLRPYGDATGPALLMKVSKGEVDSLFLDRVREAAARFGSVGPTLAKTVATSVQADPSRRDPDLLRRLNRP